MDFPDLTTMVFTNAEGCCALCRTGTGHEAMAAKVERTEVGLAGDE